MASPRMLTMRSSLWTSFLLSAVVTCSTGLSSSDVQNDEVTFTAPLKPADLQQQKTTEQDATDIIMWFGHLDGLSYKPPMTTDCQLSYAFVPCPDKPGVYAFLLLVFGFILFKAAGLVSEGIRSLLRSWDPESRVPTSPLLIVKTLPASFIILSIAFAGNPELAGARAQVGICLLAGTTALMFSLVWGLTIIAGHSDLFSPLHKEHTKGWTLKETGVATLPATISRAIFLPVCVVLPFLIAQIPVSVGWSDGYTPLLLTFLFSLFGLYALFMQGPEQLIENAKPRAHRPSSPGQPERPFGPSSNDAFWLLEDGVTPNRDVLKEVFKVFDKDHSGFMSKNEMHGFVVALGLGQGAGVPAKSVVEKWMKRFDTTTDGKLSQDEFVIGMEKLYKMESPMQDLLLGKNFQELKLTLAAFTKDMEQHDYEESAKSSATEGDSKCQLKFIALLRMSAGLVLAALVSIPLVDCIQDFSKFTSISLVVISFVAIPLLLNVQEGLSSASIAGKKNNKHVSIAVSKIFGELFLHNFLPLAIFALVLFFRRVKWDFLPEVLVILIAYLAIGIVASVRKNFPLWIGVLALLGYPIFIALEIVFHLHLRQF